MDKRYPKFTIKLEHNGLYYVGFYGMYGKWYAESSYPTEEQAFARINLLRRIK